MILVADSGSTKTEWITDCGHDIETQGINPVRDSLEKIREVIGTGLMPYLVSSDNSKTVLHSLPIAIYFYGAGCIPPFINAVEDVLHEFFPESDIFVGSDLLGAARALCGNNAGIACILGTGSNSCLIENGMIKKNIHPLGYILGDEGSGAVLGRTLVSEMLKGSLKRLWSTFQKEMSLTETDIINNVYRRPLPNKFLAGLVPFIVNHQDDSDINDMLHKAFMSFIERNVVPYNHPELAINMVGGIACQFKNEITNVIHEKGLKAGIFIKRPALGMLNYHLNR